MSGCHDATMPRYDNRADFDACPYCGYSVAGEPFHAYPYSGYSTAAGALSTPYGTFTQVSSRLLTRALRSRQAPPWCHVGVK